MKDLDQKILDKKGDFRIYYYEGQAILRKIHPRKYHKHKEVLSAVGAIKALRKANRYKLWQLVIIDFTARPSKIIWVNNPPKT